MAAIGVYIGDVTAGGKDGSLVDTDRFMDNPISVVLNSADSESKCVKCAVRCVQSCKTSGATMIGFMYWDGSQYQSTGGTLSHFKVALDNGYTQDNVESSAEWHDSILIDSEITDVNTLFWVKIGSAPNETPVSDTTIALTVKSTIVAVE